VIPPDNSSLPIFPEANLAKYLALLILPMEYVVGLVAVLIVGTLLVREFNQKK